MFLVNQIPVIDGRSFDLTDTTRLTKPRWTGEREAGHAFLRNMGAMRERRRGAVDGWQSEGIYGSAARWLRYRDSHGIVLPLSKNQTGAIATPVFRRWMGDGRLVYRLEIGWRIRLRSALDPTQAINEMLRSYFRTQVTLIDGKMETPVRLSELSYRTLTAYNKMTTKNRTVLSPVAHSMIRHGQSVLFMEYRATELPGTFGSKEWSQVPLERELAAGFEIWTTRVEAGGQSVVVYCVRRAGESGDDQRVVRALRINLLRMHAETEGLAELVHWHRDRAIAALLRNNQQGVNDHLEEALRQLRRDRGKLADTAGFRMARSAINVGTRGNLDWLLEEIQFRWFEPSQKLIAITKSLIGERRPISLNVDISNNKNEFVDQSVNKAGNTEMSTNNTNNNTSNSGTFTNSPVSNAQGGDNSTVTATATLNMAKVQEALAEIDAAMRQVLPKLTPEQQAELKMRLKDVKKESQSREWYSVTAKGLMEAATAIGSIAAPVAKTVSTLLTLLG